MGRGAPILIVLLLAVLGGLAWLVLDSPPQHWDGPREDAGEATSVLEAERGGASLDMQPGASADAGAGTGSSAADLGTRRTTAGPGALDGDREPAVGATPIDGEYLEPDPYARTLERDQVLFYGRLRLAGKPVVGADVSLDGDKEAAAATTTDERGYFELVGKEQTLYHLHAEAPGTFPTSTPLAALHGETRRNLGNIPTWAATWVRLDVKTADGAEPVNLWGYSADRDDEHREKVRIGALGEHLVLAPTLGRIHLGAEGYQGTVVRVPSKLEDGLEATLWPGARLAVHVNDPQGFGIGGAQVFLVPDHLVDELPGRFRFEALTSALVAAPGVLKRTTDDSGLVTFGELTHNGYVVYAQHPDFLPEQLAFLDAEKITERGTVTGALVPAPRLYVGLRGADGTVPAGLRVGAHSELEDSWMELTPDSKGVVRRVLPHEGRWTVQAWAPGYRMTELSAVTDYTPELMAQVMPQALSLRPLAGPGVVFIGPDDLPLEEVELEVAVAALGHWSLGSKAAWRHTWRGEQVRELALDRPSSSERIQYEVRHEGLRSQLLTAAAWPRRSAGSSEEAPWVVQLQPALEVVVQVLDGLGKPVPNAVVYLTHSEQAGIGPERTDFEGRCTFSDLPPGDVSAKARGPAGGISSKDEAELAFGEASPRLELAFD